MGSGLYQVPFEGYSTVGWQDWGNLVMVVVDLSQKGRFESDSLRRRLRHRWRVANVVNVLAMQPWNENGTRPRRRCAVISVTAHESSFSTVSCPSYDNSGIHDAARTIRHPMISFFLVAYQTCVVLSRHNLLHLFCHCYFYVPYLFLFIHLYGITVLPCHPSNYRLVFPLTTPQLARMS